MPCMQHYCANVKNKLPIIATVNISQQNAFMFYNLRS